MSSPSPSNSPSDPLPPPPVAAVTPPSSSPPPPDSSDSPPPQTTPPPVSPPQSPPVTIQAPPPSTMASPPPVSPPSPPQSPPSPPPVSPPPPPESPPSPPPPVPTPPTPTTPPPETPPTSPPPDPPPSPPPSPPFSPPPTTPVVSPPPSTPVGTPPPSPPPSPPRTPPGSPPRTPPPEDPPSPPPPPQPPNRSPPPPPRPPRNSPPPPPAPANTPESSPSPPPPSAHTPESSPSPPPPSAHTPESSPSPPPPNSSTTPIVPPPSNIPGTPPSTIPGTPPTISFSPPPPPSLAPPSFSSTPPRSDNNTTESVAIGLGVAFLFLGLFAIIACCLWKRKRKASGHGHIIPTSVTSTDSDLTLLKVQVSGTNNGSSGSRNGYSPREGGMGNSRSWFTYDELLEATGGFTANNLLGTGGFGSVYQGYLVDGRVVAVKQLKIGGGQGEREFRAEVEIISRIHHRHLVSLVGYCISEEKRLLVYEYVPNNTLYFHLHGEGRPVMDWTTRVKIAMGAARGITYLHEDCHPRIIHRDIKSSNILLDTNFEAKVADFGLAKLAEDANTHITTRVMGTFGYMAPEYASSGKLTEKSDVYSFGVVLLELISGRKPVDTSQPLGEESLVEWARPLLNDAIETEEFETLADPRLEGNFVDAEMFRMIQAAAACVRHSSSKRPRMGQVVRAFDGMVTSDLTNGMRVGESEIYNSAQQSAEIRLFQRMAFGSHEYSTDFFTQSSVDSERNKVNSGSQSRKV